MRVVLLLFFAACSQKSTSLSEAFACANGDKAACQRHFDDTKKRCDDGKGDACVLFGIQHQNDRVVAKDEKRATELFEKACALGNADGCWYAASSYGQGRGVEKNGAKSAELAEKSCNGGSVNGCYELAVIYEYGRGRDKDAAKAKELYGKACALSKNHESGLGCAQAK